MRFDLQKFGEEVVPEVADTGEPKSTDAGESTPEPAQDVKALIDDAIAKAQAKWEAEFKKRAELEKKEAQRLSQLSDDERQKAELEFAQAELEKQKQAFAAEKIKYEATKVIAQRGLPVEFVEYLVDSDNEKTLARITTFEKKYKKAIEDGVNEKLKGKAPTASGGKSVESTSSVKADFMKAIYDNQIHR